MAMMFLRKIFQGVKNFFFAEKSPYPLALFRIIFGGYFLCFFAINCWFLKLHYGFGGVLYDPLVHPVSQHTPNLIIFFGPSFFWLFFFLTIIAGMFFTLGLFTRLSAFLAWILTISWFNYLGLGINSGDYIFRILTFLLLVAALAEHIQKVWSLDAFLSRLRKKKSGGLLLGQPTIRAWTTRLFQFQFILIYVVAGVSKLFGNHWLDGTAMYYVFNATAWTRFNFTWLAAHPLLVLAATYGTLLFEIIIFPVFIWPRKTKTAMIVLGALFHLGIGLMLRIFTFTYVVPLFYLCFLEDYHIGWLRRKANVFVRSLSPHKKEAVPSVIFFDGVCNLCNESIQFVIKNDTGHYFHFAPLQSRAGEDILRRLGKSREHFEAIILTKGNKVYEKSSAALLIAAGLDFPWPLFSIFLIVPRPIRNGVYDFIARHRYSWFGKQNTCMVPTPELESLFLN